MELLVIEHEQTHRLPVVTGDNLLKVLRRSSMPVTAPCGGRGTCGKCRVNIDGLGSVLSCQTSLTDELWHKAGLTPDQPLVVRLAEVTHAQISTRGILPDILLSPLVRREQVKLAIPTLEDQRPDDLRVQQETRRLVPFRLLPQLPGLLRSSRYEPSWYYRVDTNEIVRFVSLDRPGPLGMALDIGTTTLAAYLCDLSDGRLLASSSMLNPQGVYGADVISRIEQAAAGHGEELHQVVSRAIGELAGRLLDKAGRRSGIAYVLEDIAHLVIAGNTTMMHLLCRLPADAIAQTPFIPASVRSLTLLAEELGIPLTPGTVCQLLPSIAGYVGADITAGILATGIHHSHSETQRNSLLLDIGTNGEIVLSAAGGMVACSTAAGPAFEAANITCGLGGVQGAIDQVIVNDDDLAWTVIGQDNGFSANGQTALARGICGSGLVAAVSVMLQTGLIDETGRIEDDPDELPPALGRRITSIDGQTAVILAGAGHSATGQMIYLTQKDIRELQNAKAAIAAGIELLIEQSGLKPEQIDDVFIAGGFGNYLDIEHALRIGLIPAAFRGKTRSAGNTAGMGALTCLLQQDVLQDAATVARQVTYYELSADKRFTDLYIDAMLFPEE